MQSTYIHRRIYFSTIWIHLISAELYTVHMFCFVWLVLPGGSNQSADIENILWNAMSKLEVLYSYDGLYHYHCVITVFLGIWHLTHILSYTYILYTLKPIMLQLIVACHRLGYSLVKVLNISESHVEPFSVGRCYFLYPYNPVFIL